MNAMQHRSAWVSAAVLLGVAGTAGATGDALAASHSVAASGEMRSIPVERIRPQRQEGVEYTSVAVERVRPVREADLIALLAMGVFEGDELCAGGSDQDPAPRRTSIPFDRSALVPTGSRWADDRQPTYTTAVNTTTERTSRWGDLVPTPLPTGQNTQVATATPAPATTTAQATTTVASTPVASTQATTPPSTTPVTTAAASTSVETTTPSTAPEGWPTLTMTAESDTASTTTQAVETTTQSEPVVVAESTTTTTPVVTTEPATTAAVETTTPPVTTTVATETTTAPTRTSGFTSVATPVTTTNTQPVSALSRSERTARLAAMFPAPEGWGSSTSRSTQSRSNLVATPMPTQIEAANQPRNISEPATRSEPTGTMSPIGDATIDTDDQSRPTTTTASAEPAAMSVRANRPAVAFDEATEEVLSELRRKAVTQDAYDRAMRELAARREAGIQPQGGALMAGDSLGESIARSAGYID